ncbi:MAG: cupin [Leptolyngbyaceae cyanobacterium CSU_1_4]|nr:cupin [Leptolyngbyaceae cyanobacterium CSU_1_4]
MVGQDWFVTNEGQCIEAEVFSQDEAFLRPYRLYRFLTDLEDILERVHDDSVRLTLICPLVRRLLNSSEWLHMNFLPPDPTTGWSVVMLYNEPDFSITIQNVVWSPGSVSPIHNHATWGVVALLSGQEKNSFWQRSPTPDHPDRLQPVGDCLLNPGDVLCLMPNTIHQVETIGDEPTISFNLYGETNFDQRFEFDLAQQTAQVF